MTGARGQGRSVRMGLWTAWATSMAVGIAASWIYVLAVITLEGDLVPFLKDVAEDPKNAVIFLVALTGTTVFIETGPALFGIFLLGWPFHLLSQRHRRASRGHYLLGGLGIALVVGVPLLAAEVASDMFGPVSVICTEAVAILVAGPLAMWMFWWLVRPDRLGSDPGGRHPATGGIARRMNGDERGEVRTDANPSS